MTAPLVPEDPLLQAKRVAELVGLLRAFLSGQKSRVDIARWTDKTLPDRHFSRHGSAHVVFESLLNIEERYGDGFVLRNQDLAAYLDWLTRGDLFVAMREPLISISTPIETLASMIGRSEERSWLDGLGWMVTLRFASLATGRCYCAMAPLRNEPKWSSIHAHRDDDQQVAALDIIEALEIDESDVKFWHSLIELTKLPRWSLWRQDDNGGRFEVNSYLSYSRAMRESVEMENRGHKQMYWVERQQPEGRA